MAGEEEPQLQLPQEEEEVETKPRPLAPDSSCFEGPGCLLHPRSLIYSASVRSSTSSSPTFSSMFKS